MLLAGNWHCSENPPEVLKVWAGYAQSANLIELAMPKLSR